MNVLIPTARARLPRKRSTAAKPAQLRPRVLVPRTAAPVRTRNVPVQWLHRSSDTLKWGVFAATVETKEAFLIQRNSCRSAYA